MIVRPADAERFVARPPAGIAAVLLYGPNRGLVEDRGERLDSAPDTVTVTNFDAPSPSRTICRARSVMTARNFVLKSARRGSAADVTRRCRGPRAVANVSTESDVDVSPSTDIALNEVRLAVAVRR